MLKLSDSIGPDEYGCSIDYSVYDGNFWITLKRADGFGESLVIDEYEQIEELVNAIYRLKSRKKFQLDVCIPINGKHLIKMELLGNDIVQFDHFLEHNLPSTAWKMNLPLEKLMEIVSSIEEYFE